MPVVPLLLACLAFAACGGGSSSGGSLFGGSGYGDNISLLSITFPKRVDLLENYDEPPLEAPLSQQIVFTFSGPVEGPVKPSSIWITSDPGLSYDGPLALYDPETNLIRALGTFEVFSNVVVFTPQLPMTTMNLDSVNASLDELPGLLPGRTYDIFIPVGSTDAISNLKGVDPGVMNPLSFSTGSMLTPNMYFTNFLQDPPLVLETEPKDGRVNFPVNTLKVMAGFDPFEELSLVFDQPLHPDKDRLKGRDGNNDGIIEPNIFLRFSDKLLIANSYQFKGLFRLDREDPGKDPGDTFKLTQYDGVGVPLSDVAFDLKSNLLGLSQGLIYSVNYKTPEKIIELEIVLDTGYAGLKGLASSRRGFFYSLDLESGGLVQIDFDPQNVSELGTIEKADTVRDLAFGSDEILYLLRVEGAGGPSPVSCLETVNLADASTELLIGDLYGSFTSMEFVNSRTLCLFEEEGRGLWTLDLKTGVLVEKGPIAAPWNAGLDLAALFFEMDADPVLLENKVDGSRLSINPQGMLPFDNEVEIMVRNRLENIRGWSWSNEDPQLYPPFAAKGWAIFFTLDPGPAAMEDEFFEDFDDREFESLEFQVSKANALWNFQDTDNKHPHFEKLVATLGLGGSGELGKFEPTGFYKAITLDTDYQPLPLSDGSTPDVKKPIVVLGGKFNFTSMHIPNGISVHSRGSNPLVITATEDVLIEGTIDVSGLMGGYDITFDSGFVPVPGGLGGPGSGRGGMGQPPVPPDFQAFTQLYSPAFGENGWGPRNDQLIGGKGGQTGAFYDFKKNQGVPYKGAAAHAKSRGAGGGGGSMLWQGMPGQPGKGNHVPDELGRKVEADMPLGGLGGNLVFTDGDPDNNFFGPLGEIKELHGGQGGGGAGSRWDSLNPNCVKQTWVGYPNCMWDGKGGGGGGAGGAVAIHAMGRIQITKTGEILACGGPGGGGEQVGASNFGGAGGGGSGGVVILHSGEKIILEESNTPYPNNGYKKPWICGAIIDVSGGRMGDAKEKTSTTYSTNFNPCPNSGLPSSGYCTLTNGDGGQGGYGIIQLMVDEPDVDLSPAPKDILRSTAWVGATIFATDPLEFPSGSNKPPYYMKNHLTWESTADAYPKVFQFGKDPADPEHKIKVDEPPLVDPYKTAASLTPLSFGISKWIDFAGVMTRPNVDGHPHLPAPVFLGFRGTDPITGVVITENGYVKDWHKGNELYNDIEVDAPSKSIDNYIPEDNEVNVMFQGARAVAPGLHVPDPDTMTPWTADVTNLHGYPLVRFRVRLDAAKNGDLNNGSPRPQVNRIRIRVKY